MVVARRYKFPDPKARSAEKPAVFCIADRVLHLFNQDNDLHAQRISKKVRKWFFDKAHDQGWNGVQFIPEVQSLHGAGCMLWVEQNRAHIKITKTMLVLISSEDK